MLGRTCIFVFLPCTWVWTIAACQTDTEYISISQAGRAWVADGRLFGASVAILGKKYQYLYMAKCKLDITNYFAIPDPY